MYILLKKKSLAFVMQLLTSFKAGFIYFQILCVTNKQ